MDLIDKFEKEATGVSPKELAAAKAELLAMRDDLS